jgi:hypothetical protein
MPKQHHRFILLLRKKQSATVDGLEIREFLDKREPKGKRRHKQKTAQARERDPQLWGYQ